MGCVFCDIIEGVTEGVFIYRNDDIVAFLDKYPIDSGHTLIVTRRHYERITDMDDVSVGVLFSKVPKIARAVLAGTGADAFSIAQNNGKAAKQIIPHVHVHVIPRFSSRGVGWTKREILTQEEMESQADEIKKHL